MGEKVEIDSSVLEHIVSEVRGYSKLCTLAGDVGTGQKFEDIAEALEDATGTGDVHVWKCTSPGMYESLYMCVKCELEHCESADDPSTVKPKRGCTGTI